MKNRSLFVLIGFMIGLSVISLMEWIAGFNNGVDSDSAHDRRSFLYYATVRVVKSDTGGHVPFQVHWSDDAVSPFAKGSGPSVIRKRENGDVDIVIVGNYVPNGLPVDVSVEGVNIKVLRLLPHGGGISKMDDEKATVVVTM